MSILNPKKRFNQPSSVDSDTNVVAELTRLITDIISTDNRHSTKSIIQSLNVILVNDKDLLVEAMKFITEQEDVSRVKEDTKHLRKQLSAINRSKVVVEAVSSARYQLMDSADKDEERFDSELIKLINTLQTFRKNNSSDGMMDHKFVLSSNDNDLSELDLVNTETAERFVSGWAKLNTALQGGVALGEMVVFNALAFNYKTSLLQTLFIHAGLFNKPFDRGRGKGTILYITLEEDPRRYIWFFYKYLYYLKNGVLPKKGAENSASIMSFIAEEMSRTGFHVEAIKILASDFSLDKLKTLVEDYESAGFDIQGIWYDYLAKTPLTGLSEANSVVYGTKELFRSTREYFNGKKIAFTTVHQLNSSAKDKLKDGTPSMDFVKEVAGKGYTEKNRTLDQEPDIDFTIHIGHENRKSYLTFMNTKSRGDKVITEEEAYFVEEFPKEAPIMPDVFNKNRIHGEAVKETKKSNSTLEELLGL
jgi:hypothetical protein